MKETIFFLITWIHKLIVSLNVSGADCYNVCHGCSPSAYILVTKSKSKSLSRRGEPLRMLSCPDYLDLR